MNIVLDTNILISALVFGGKPDQILNMVLSEKVTAYSSEQLMREFRNVLAKKFPSSQNELKTIEATLRTSFKLVKPKRIPEIIIHDPADNHVLAITHKAKIDYIITGDHDLLTLEKYRGARIVTPNNFLQIIR